MKSVFMVIIASALLVTFGCSDCLQEFLDARLPATIKLNETTRSAIGFDFITETDPDGNYDEIIRALENASQDTGIREVAWPLRQGLDGIAAPGRAFFIIRLPVVQGETIQVDSPTITVQDWTTGNGELGTSETQRLRAGIRFGVFSADHVKGTAQVLSTSPLSLKFTLTYTTTANDSTVELTGDQTFEVNERPDLCD